MLKLWATFKVLFTANYLTWRTSKKGSRKQIALLLLMGFSLLPFLRLLFELANGVYQAAVILGDPPLALLLAAAAGQLAMLVFGLPYLASVLYYEDDFVRLAPLPLAPWQVVGAKFMLVWLGELVTLFFTVGPSFIVFGLRSDIRPYYWLVLAVVYVFLPVIPLVTGTVLTTFVMHLGGHFRDRDKARVLFSGLVIILVVGIQSILLRSGSAPGNFLQEKLIARPHLAAKIKLWLPTALWVQLALTKAGTVKGTLYLFAFGLVSVASIAFLGLLSPGIFKRALSEQETPPRAAARGKKSKRAYALNPASSPFIACLKREARLFWRTPIFALNGILNLILLPLLILLPIFVQGNLRNMANLFAGLDGFEGLIGLVLAAAIGFTAAMNQISSTAISREGELLFWSLTLPLDPKTQLLAKLVFALSFQASMTLIWTALVYFFLPSGWLYLISGAVLGLLASWALAQIGLLIDLTWPHTQWTDPQKAMKGNLNSLFAGLGGWLLLALSGLFLWVFYHNFQSWLLTYTAAFTFYVVVGLVLYRLLLIHGCRRWPKLLS